MNLRDYIESLNRDSDEVKYIELIVIEQNQESVWKNLGTEHPYTTICIEDIIETDSPLVPDGILLKIKYLTDTYSHKTGEVSIHDLNWASLRQVVQEKKIYYVRTINENR